MIAALFDFFEGLSMEGCGLVGMNVYLEVTLHLIDGEPYGEDQDHDRGGQSST